MPLRPVVFLAITALCAGACVSAVPQGPEPPAPASEPRATLRMRVDLVRAQRCEETFDLALYQDRGIELIAWDAGRGCEDRTLTVRYLTGRTSPDKIFRAVQQAGGKVLASPQIPGEPR